jgi:transcriptional regulator of acetoin/glycerol metabolism
MGSLSTTISSMSVGREATEDSAVEQLVLSLRCDRPQAPPSRYLLRGLEEVRFGRGEPMCERRGNTLTLRIDDPRMSSDHGRLVRRGEAWHIEDPSSKNGCVVNGALTRSGVIGDHDTLELGHTFFVFRVATAVAGPPDLSATALASPAPELATFAGDLAASYVRLEKVAPTDVPVLVFGETGTGKELAARAVHTLSQRKGPFVALNCGALPETLVEAELFGAKRGAFSGAQADRLGLVRSADGGTLFLDEIGELRPSSQAALLRVLQEREVMPLGDTRAVKVDVRFCAATHRQLEDMVDSGAFRRDLYSRLFGFTLDLPPLRERREDLGLLIRALLARRDGGDRASFTPAAARVLHQYDWPHNVRELERVLSTSVALADGRPIDVMDLPEPVRRGPTRAPAPPPQDSTPLRGELVALLEQHKGNVAAVARALGKDRTQIHRWVRRFALDLDSFRRD